MMCRACLKCKKFIIVKENFIGHKELDKFEQQHRFHPLVTLQEHELDPTFSKSTPEKTPALAQ